MNESSLSNLISLCLCFQFVLIDKQHYLHTEAHPLFFDSLFPSFQTTTPETVISDYRQQKRADSSAEHSSSDVDELNTNETKNNVEFYAEVVGKLVGTIRDGFTSLIYDVKQRHNKLKGSSDEKNETKVISLKQYKDNNLNVTNMKGLIADKEFNANETNKMQIANDSLSKQYQRSSININDIGMTTEHQEIKLTDAQRDSEIESESVETDKGENGIKSPTESSSTTWDGVVQVIARRKQHKRSEMSQHNQNGNGADEMDLEQLEFPIASGFPFNDEITNDHMSSDNSAGDESNQSDDSDDEKREKWFTKHQKSFARISENHRRRKQKLIEFLSLFLKSSSNETLANEENDDEHEDLSLSDDLKLSFAIKRGNCTIVHLTPKEFLRMFHRGSDEHAELQKKAKTLLQRVFYKYARLYLVARKGYKDARSFNRMAKELHQEQVEDMPSVKASVKRENKFSHHLEINETLNRVNNYDDDDESFMTNDARSSLQALESFTILILEIFGVILGLSLGAIAQIQTGFIIDI